MISVQQWFDDGCDYNLGVNLYASLPKSNKNIARLLSRKQSAINLEKLKYELKKLSQRPVLVQPKAVVVSAKPKLKPSSPYVASVQLKEQNKRAVFFHQLPESLRPVLLKANTLFKECCMLKVQLNELPDEDANNALELQLEISDKRKKNEHCWKQIDYWLDHKQVPEIEVCEFNNLTAAQLLRKDQYLFQSISKLKKRRDENKEKLKRALTKKEKNRLNRAIARQESNIINKEHQQTKIKDLINGRR